MSSDSSLAYRASFFLSLRLAALLSKLVEDRDWSFLFASHIDGIDLTERRLARIAAKPPCTILTMALLCEYITSLPLRV